MLAMSPIIQPTCVAPSPEAASSPKPHSVFGYRAHLNVQAHFATLSLHNLGNVVHAELLCDLIVHTHLATGCRVVNGQLDAAHLHAEGYARHSALSNSTAKWAEHAKDMLWMFVTMQ